MRTRGGLACLFALAGCATAGKDGNGTDASGGKDGAGQIDARQLDAPSGVDAIAMATLSETADNTVTVGQTRACGNGNGTIAWTTENSWYRVFPLASFGITGPFKVTAVSFGVQEASGTQTVQVKIGTYAGTPGTTIAPAMITSLNSAMVNVPTNPSPQTLTALFSTANTVPANGKLVVEVFTPDHANQAVDVYLGASAGTETAPGYLRAPGCGTATPTSMKVLDATAGSLLISVTGTH